MMANKQAKQAKQAKRQVEVKRKGASVRSKRRAGRATLRARPVPFVATGESLESKKFAPGNIYQQGEKPVTSLIKHSIYEPSYQRPAQQPKGSRIGRQVKRAASWSASTSSPAARKAAADAAPARKAADAKAAVHGGVKKQLVRQNRKWVVSHAASSPKNGAGGDKRGPRPGSAPAMESKRSTRPPKTLVVRTW